MMEWFIRFEERAGIDRLLLAIHIRKDFGIARGNLQHGGALFGVGIAGVGEPGGHCLEDLEGRCV